MTRVAGKLPIRWLTALALLFLLCACYSIRVTAGSVTGFDIALPKQRLPAPLIAATDLADSKVSLDEFRGKVVLVHFWATFCVPCLHEMPALEALWQAYRDQGLVILGIAADRGSERVVRDYVRDSGITFPVVQDTDGAVRNRYEVVALPMSYLVGRDGRISARAVGARDWRSAQGHRLIESLLDSNAGM